MDRILGKEAVGRNNNLDILRFVAAILVIICHSVPISMGDGNADILSRWNGGKVSIGGMAVGFFFVTGGFLILKSAENKKNICEYGKARVLRIFPPLIAFAAVMALIVGPIISELSLSDYYADSKTYKYMLNGIFIIQHNLPGVFEGNAYEYVVNGSLWTLPIEFLCYILCFICVKIKITLVKTFKYTIPAASVFIVASMIYFRDNIMILSVILQMAMFYIGMLFYTYRNSIRLNFKVFAVVLCLFVVLMYFKLSFVAMMLCYPYIIFMLAFGTTHKLDGFGKYGEFSYGMYLWGWPVQQIVCQSFGGSMKWYENVLISLPFVIILGVINYYLVEKPVNKWQKRKNIIYCNKKQ